MRQHTAPPGWSLTAVALTVAALLLAGGCFAKDGASSAPPRTGGTQDPALELARAGPSSKRLPTTAATAMATATVEPTATTGARGPKSRSKGPRGVVLLDRPDAAGDAGPGPRWSDLRRLTVAEAGHALMIAVGVHGDLPSELRSGQSVRLGVDLVREGRRGREYHLLLEGGADGWRAGLHTPRGLRRLPGTHAVRGGDLTVLVPWSALGGRASLRAAAFLDWSLHGRGQSHDSIAPARLALRRAR